MRIYKIAFTSLVALVCLFGTADAQPSWAGYHKTINAKDYQGKNFRLTAMARTEVQDDSAASHLWARVDKQKSMGFFDNMKDRPIRNAAWQHYSLVGKIDTGAYDITFGVWCIYNGKFYFDNIKLEVETGKGKWITVFAANFEDGTLDSLMPGVQRTASVAKSDFTATVVNENNGKALLIEADNAPNFGDNKKVGKFADVNGIKLYYEIYGAGPPLVVLHGNGGSISSASEFYEGLMKHYKVIAIGSRSQGKSTSTDGPLNYDMMASDVNALLNQLNIDSAFIWGQSDGAILGLLLAKDYPKKVKRVLAYGANIQPDSLALFPWALDHMKKIVKESKDPKAVALNQMMLDYPNIPYDELSKIQAPILFMAGDRDVIRIEHTVKMFQHVPNSQLCILPGATHGGAWEKKDLFLQIMNDFFNKPFTMPDTKNWYSN